MSAGVLFMLASSIGEWATLLDHRVDEVIAATELEQRVGDFNRAWNQQRVGLAGGEDAMIEARARMEQALARVDSMVISSTEEAALRQVEESIARWIARRTELEAQGLEIDEVLSGQHFQLDTALNRIRTLRALNRRDLEHAQEEISLQASQQRIIALGTVGLETLGLLVVLAGLVGAVIRPMRELEETLRRYTAGDLEVRAEERGAAELASIAQTFNGLADALARQGQERLVHLGGVVHDLRDPLTAVSLATGRLRRVVPAESQAADTVATLRRHVSRMEQMIQDILDASRIEAGRLEFELVEADLGQILRRVVRDFEERDEQHHFTLRVEEEALPLHGDPSRLEQVFTNLMSNACKYSPAGTEVIIEARAEGPVWAVSVHDEGAGLAEDELERIFMPFQRGGSAGRAIPGAGLGLSVVRKIVVAHRGTLQVQSAVGVGSTFTVRLPRTSASGEPAGKPVGPR